MISDNNDYTRRSTDGGRTWQEVELTGRFYGLTSRGDTIFTAGQKGSIYFSTDKGSIWSKRLKADDYRINSVYFVDKDTGFIGGLYPNSARIYKTTDRGNSWIQVLYNSTSLTGISSIYFISGGKTGFALNESNECFKTTDYGNNWTRFTPPLSNFNETVQILFSDEMNGYLLIKNSILKTTDQGLNWVKKTLPLTGDAKGMIFLDENIGFVWGKAMNILKTTDGGLSWSNKYSITWPLGETIDGINFFNSADGFAWSTSTLLRTSNLGESWENAQTYGHFFPIAFMQNEHGVARYMWPGTLPYYLHIVITHDGGQNWDTYRIPEYSVINAAAVADPGTFYLVGNDNVILKITDESYTGIETEKKYVGSVQEFKLFENFPNPFNPSTKIRFVLSEERIITLKVFDVLGNEVATLIDGDELKPGKYEHTYDASGLSSGVYFYTISAIGKGSSPSFVRTGKMLLLK